MFLVQALDTRGDDSSHLAGRAAIDPRRDGGAGPEPLPACCIGVRAVPRDVDRALDRPMAACGGRASAGDPRHAGRRGRDSGRCRRRKRHARARIARQHRRCSISVFFVIGRLEHEDATICNKAGPGADGAERGRGHGPAANSLTDGERRADAPAPANANARTGSTAQAAASAAAIENGASPASIANTCSTCHGASEAAGTTRRNSVDTRRNGVDRGKWRQPKCRRQRPRRRRCGTVRYRQWRAGRSG